MGISPFEKSLLNYNQTLAIIIVYPLVELEKKNSEYLRVVLFIMFCFPYNIQNGKTDCFCEVQSNVIIICRDAVNVIR